jgi:ubiquinone/menaquinone biosynthesis C-methylase UbiE
MNIDSRPAHNAAVFGKIAQKYTDEYFDDDADFPYIARFLKNLKPGGRILDIACGPGMLTKHLLDKGFQAEGIDLSGEMIAIARQKVPQAKFQIMDMRHLEYPDKAFDGLLLTYGLIYIPSDELTPTLNEFSRVLKPKGSIFMINQEGKSDHIEQEPMKPDESLYVNFFTAKSLETALSGSGFEIIDQELVPIDNPAVMAKNIIYTIAQKTS